MRGVHVAKQKGFFCLISHLSEGGVMVLLIHSFLFNTNKTCVHSCFNKLLETTRDATLKYKMEKG